MEDSSDFVLNKPSKHVNICEVQGDGTVIYEN